MTLRKRIAMGVVAVLFAAAPSLAIAAMACTGCCCPPTPCHGTLTGGEMAPLEAPCCDDAQAAAPTPAKRNLDAPTVHASLSERSYPVADSCRARPLGRADLERLVSALRLSVVLRI